ncbi:hypothetical protein DE146DRAFT_668025 [Phaeosphaeria sp. MPI-PUGE-AT-0046c]|nr:hypothetical protein DE146DRAFT_668025 [Phaeosphaeria sp. MPI-PUGE-AT-0046c]
MSDVPQPAGQSSLHDQDAGHAQSSSTDAKGLRFNSEGGSVNRLVNRSDRGIVFITGGTPADFKFEGNMRSIRSKTMDSSVNSDGKLAKSSPRLESSDSGKEREKGGRTNQEAIGYHRKALESRLQDINITDPNEDDERPLSNTNRRKLLVFLQTTWDLRPGHSVSPEASTLLLLLRRLLRSKVEEAMALFEAIVSTCPVIMRTALLNSILEHVDSGLPLERWWTTAGPSDKDAQLPTNDTFDNFVICIENKWRLEHDGSSVDEANKLYEQIKQMFYTSRTKLDEGIAFFETVAGGCDENKRAELLHAILQQIKKGDSPEQWWASLNHDGVGQITPEEPGSTTTYAKSMRVSTKRPDADSMDKGSLLFITATNPSDFKSKNNMATVRKQAMSSFLSNEERGLGQSTPHKKSTPTVLPTGTHNRDSSYSSERGASLSRFATPQTLPSLTERSTISPRRITSPWTPLEIGGPIPDTALTLTSSHMAAIMEVDDTLEPGTLDYRLEEYRQRSATKRRKRQNMLAQQAFLARKKRLEDAKQEEEPKREAERDVPKQGTETTSVSVNREVLLYQLPGEQVHIQCVCGNVNDGRFIIPCITCGRWQHIRCYYELAQDVVENHECTQCDPRELNGQGNVQAKRSAEEDLDLAAASTATQSAKRQKSMSAHSSITPSIKPLQPLFGQDHGIMSSSKANYQNILDGTSSVLGLSYPSTIATSLSASKSNYQNLSEGTAVPRVIYPPSLATNLTSKRTSHKIAEQGRRDRIIMALQEMETLLPSKQKLSLHLVGGPPSSKASTVESAIEYIKELQQQIREKDWLLENKDRQLEQLWAQDFTYSDTLSERSAEMHEINPIPLSSPDAQSHDDIRPDHTDGDPMVTHDTVQSVNHETSHVSSPDLVATTDAATPEDQDANMKNEDHEALALDELPEANALVDCKADLDTDWTKVQAKLPESWMWDVEYQPSYWTCTPLEVDEPKHYPLRIASAPVVLPVEHQWPPMGGVNPPPDPRPSAPIDCTASLPLEDVRDLFLTFEKSIGFYLLFNDILQIIVPDDFDTTWASSHLPHKYGGLKVCYILQTLEATMLPSATETSKMKPVFNTQNTGLSSIFRQSRQSTASSYPALRLNDFIEARPKANHRKEKYAGRIGLKVLRANQPYLVMSTHAITEAILAKSHRETFFGRGRGRFDKLDDDWNEHIDIWAGNEKIGTIDKSFDKEAEVYPNGFHHDVTLVKPTTSTSVKDVVAPMSNLGWLCRDSWNSLRQQTSAVKILGTIEDHRSAKSIRCSRPSEILVVGEGIFLNQTAAVGTSKSLKDHDMSTWKSLVSRALLYRVYPDFDPPNGHSGVALYADGMREDGSHGPGIVGFQSFVQRSGHVQNFNMEGPALERRLQLGRIAFYGAFEVPEELKREYTIA